MAFFEQIRVYWDDFKIALPYRLHRLQLALQILLHRIFIITFDRILRTTRVLFSLRRNNVGRGNGGIGIMATVWTTITIIISKITVHNIIYLPLTIYRLGRDFVANFPTPKRLKKREERAEERYAGLMQVHRRHLTNPFAARVPGVVDLSGVRVGEEGSDIMVTGGAMWVQAEGDWEFRRRVREVEEGRTV